VRSRFVGEAVVSVGGTIRAVTGAAVVGDCGSLEAPPTTRRVDSAGAHTVRRARVGVAVLPSLALVVAGCAGDHRTLVDTYVGRVASEVGDLSADAARR